MNTNQWIKWMLGCLLLCGCSSPQHSAEKSSLPSSENPGQLRLFTNAPSGIQSLLVTVSAQELSLNPLANSFNILDNQKSFLRSHSKGLESVSLAVKPGVVVAKVYAFASENTEDLTKAIFYGSSEPISIEEGKEASVTISMKVFTHLAIENLSVIQEGSGYGVSFTTPQSLAAGTNVSILHNPINPEFLDKVLQRNTETIGTTSGTKHHLSLSGNSRPYFVKAILDYEPDSHSIQFGKALTSCSSDVCGPLPLIIYRYRISLVDDAQKDFSQGIQVGWRTSTPSDGDLYFSENYFDQHFLLQQVLAHYDLKKVGIFKNNALVSYTPSTEWNAYENPTKINCNSSACTSIKPGSSDAPSSLFKEASHTISGRILHDRASQTIYPSTTSCSESLSQLGQNCGSIPKIIEFDLDDHLLNLSVVNGTGATFEIVLKDKGESGVPLVSLPLEVPPELASDEVHLAIDFSHLGLDLSQRYLLRVKNATSRGSILEMNLADWTNLDGIETATLLTEDQVIHETRTDRILYYALDLSIGNNYIIGLAVEGYHDLQEGYLLEPAKKTIEVSTTEALLSYNLPVSVKELSDLIAIAKNISIGVIAAPPKAYSIKWIHLAPKQSGRYLLKVIHPQETLPFEVFVTRR